MRPSKRSKSAPAIIDICHLRSSGFLLSTQTAVSLPPPSTRTLRRPFDMRSWIRETPPEKPVLNNRASVHNLPRPGALILITGSPISRLLISLLPINDFQPLNATAFLFRTRRRCARASSIAVLSAYLLAAATFLQPHQPTFDMPFTPAGISLASREPDIGDGAEMLIHASIRKTSYLDAF
jgi:hypothetical protein